MKSLLISLLIAGLAYSQEGGISGPVSGYFFDQPTQSVRAMVGVPGASYFSAALSKKLDNAAVSPNGRLAIATRENSVMLLNLSDGTERVITEGRADAIAWNAGSNAAALQIAGRLQVWNSNDESFADFGAAESSALAIDASGANVFAADSNAIYRYSANGSPVQLASLREASSLSLTQDGSTLYALERSGKQVVEIDTKNGGAVMFARDAADPAGVAISRDGRSVLIADAESKIVLVYSRSQKSITNTVELSFAPTRLDTIGDGVFALNSRKSEDPLEIISLQPLAASFFVPAPKEEN